MTYGRFWRSVGEPRGVEHMPVSGSQAGYIQLLVVWPLVGARGRVIDRVLLSLVHVLLNIDHVLLSLVHVLLNIDLRMTSE